MQILVFGAGSLGSLLGAVLSPSNKVCLLSRPEHAEAVKKTGLVVTGSLMGEFWMEAVSKPSEISFDPDLIVLTTRAYDTEKSCMIIKENFSPCPVVTFQNGLDNLEKMMSIGEKNVFGAVTSMGAMLLKPGHVFCAGRGNTILQTRNNSILQKLADNLNSSGFSTDIDDNILPFIWEKVAVNLLINYLAGLGGVENGAVAESWEKLEVFALGLMEEICSAAKEDGVILEPSACAQRALEVARDTYSNRCSMLRSLENGVRTENEALAGAVLLRGKRSGMRLPRVETLYSLVCLRDGATDK